MPELSKAQKGRVAIRAFKTIADALVVRGYFKPAGESGQALTNALREVSPEIYGSMNDPRMTELKGLQYVLDRLPHGIESCTRIVLTAEEEFSDTHFEKIIPSKRRRLSYRVSEDEMCFIITHGASEIYDLLTHLTFLNIEAEKLQHRVQYAEENISSNWHHIDELLLRHQELPDSELDQALLNLSILLGRSFHETRAAYQAIYHSRRSQNSKQGLFRIVHELVKRVAKEKESRDNELTIYFTPALRDLIGHHQYSLRWADAIKEKLVALDYQQQPLHLISANLHSVVNLFYGYAFCQQDEQCVTGEDDLISLIHRLRDRSDDIRQFALQHGLTEIKDQSGATIDVQLIDSKQLANIDLHPELMINAKQLQRQQAVLMVMDYAFGEQAFQVLDDFLEPTVIQAKPLKLDVQSISIMGKAGILQGNKEDIILATAHVLEGTPHNYIVNNELSETDFPADMQVYSGPMVTVLGTSLQNRAILKKFCSTSWQAVGLDMEGGHYQRAISAAIIRQHIRADIKLRYAYYASDNPLKSGETLASGGMGEGGVRPTYTITKVIIEKILSNS